MVDRGTLYIHNTGMTQHPNIMYDSALADAMQEQRAFMWLWEAPGWKM
jgi:hypothetical protein